MHTYIHTLGSTRCEVAFFLVCETVVSEFKPHSRYYVHFRTNTLRKGSKPLVLSPLWIKKPHTGCGIK